MYLPAFSYGFEHGYHSLGSAFCGDLGISSPSQILTFSLFWPHSLPGTETMMTRHQRAPGEPLDPPAEDTHHTAGTTAVSKVGTEPSHFPSWQLVNNVFRDWLLSFWCGNMLGYWRVCAEKGLSSFFF